MLLDYFVVSVVVVLADFFFSCEKMDFYFNLFFF